MLSQLSFFDEQFDVETGYGENSSDRDSGSVNPYRPVNQHRSWRAAKGINPYSPESSVRVTSPCSPESSAKVISSYIFGSSVKATSPYNPGSSVRDVNSNTAVQTDPVQKNSCKVILFPGTHTGLTEQAQLKHELSDDPRSDPFNYDKFLNYIGPPPDGYVWASTFKKNGMRKLVARNSYRGEEKKAYPIIQKEQLEAMASWMYGHKDKKYLLAFVLGINLGLRANELLCLRKHDLFLKDGTIRYVEDVTDTSDHIRVYQKKTRNSKNSRYRNVFLNVACVNILNWYFPNTHSRFYTDWDVEADRKSIETEHCRGGKDLIFPSSYKNGEKEMTVDSFRKVLEEASRACGLPQNIATHTIRKTFGVANGIAKTVGGMKIDVDKVQRLLGHSSGTTTLRYLDTDQMSLKADYHSCCLDITGVLF